MLLSHVSLAAIPHAGVGSEAPMEFLIWPFGEIETTKGTFLFDQKAASAVMASFRDQGNRLTFDYEHAATDSHARAGDGKAAGACLLALRSDGLGAVNWRSTSGAAHQIRGSTGVYYSPTLAIQAQH